MFIERDYHEKLFFQTLGNVPRLAVWKRDIFHDIHAALMRAMESGTTFADFRRELTPILQKKGWWGWKEEADPETGEIRRVELGSPRRLRTIFDVNMRVSFAQGRWEQQRLVKDSFPYLRYEGILDSKIRPQHRLWHGIILPQDHPWWKTHYPPNGWHCRCDAVAVSDDDLKRFGWRLSETPPEEGTITWANPRTGEERPVPAGIDPGWDYNPGDTNKAVAAAMLKLIDLPPKLGIAAIKEMFVIFPLVEKELGEWIEKIVAEKTFKPSGTLRVVGSLDEDILRRLEEHEKLEPVSGAITIEDDKLYHLVRTTKVNRGNAIPIEEARKLPSLLLEPAAVYWDNGKTKEKDGQDREPGLVYVWDAKERRAGKLIIRINYKKRVHVDTLGIGSTPDGKKHVIVRPNNIVSGRVDLKMEDFNEKDGYILIKSRP